LQGLNEHESQSLFQQIRGSTFASTSANNKQDKGWEIVKDCGGVPHTIVVKAALMKQILDKEGGQIVDVKRELLEELKFIYYDELPTYQKLCFVYCSLFPEDYLIDAERLIQLWTAEGFLTIPNNNPEQFGQACFNDFVPFVFYQVEEKEEKGVYRMTWLMHKLAKEIAGDENITVDSMGGRVKEGTLHASFDFGLDLSCGIPDSMFDKAKKLRTILLPYKNINNPRLPHEVKMTTSTCDKIFTTFKSLRVLDLHDLGIKIVPISIEEMKYLRYLDLSHNNIEKLPNCITRLIHLETLKLSYSHVLKELPKDLQYLTRLNHLDIEGYLDLTHMPAGIDKLTSLQTLSLFVASKKHAITGGLRELTVLNNLKGNLEILHLEQVKFSPSIKADKDEFSKNKEHLQQLTLRWDRDDDEERTGSSSVDVDNEEKLLECLQPHQNLKVLFVVGYNGKTLSNCLHSLHCLVKFTLSDSPKCEYLPPMDHLPNLKVLHLQRLNS
jgi:leucine-rich repeat protein SHOC2